MSDAAPKDRPLRLLQVLEATTGGARRHLTDLVLSLDPRRYRIDVACSFLRDPYFEADATRMEESGARIINLPMVREVSPGADLRAVRALRRLLRAEDYDLMHTHSSKAGVIGRWAARACPRTRVVHTPHAPPFVMRLDPLRRAVFRWMERHCARDTDVIVCVSSGERQACLRAGLSASKLRVVPNGIDAPPPVTAAQRDRLRASLNLRPRDIGIATIGRLCEQKGQRFLVRAARTVCRSFPRCRFFLIGDGPDRDYLRNLIAGFELHDQVVLLGHREDAQELLGAMDLYVLPSLWEGAPYSILEAMAAELPVVATRVSGAEEMVLARQTGLLVEPRDAQALAVSISALLVNPEARRRQGAAARQRVLDQYSREQMVNGIEQVYAQALEGVR